MPLVCPPDARHAPSSSPHNACKESVPDRGLDHRNHGLAANAARNNIRANGRVRLARGSRPRFYAQLHARDCKGDGTQ